MFTLTTILFFRMIADEIYTVNSIIAYITEQIIPIGQPIFLSPDFMPVFNPFVGVIIASLLSYLNNTQRSEIMKMKNQKTKAELKYSKSQINPHFFFNRLNTLYSMVMVKGDEETAEGISRLSGLMRYIIYDTKVDLISTDKEIEYIRNFIELQKLRFSEEDGLEVTLEIFGKTKPKTIPPMLFIPFIENASKHGFSIKQKSKFFYTNRCS